MSSRLTFLKALISDGVILDKDGPDIEKESPRDVESMCKRMYYKPLVREMAFIRSIQEGTWTSKEEWDAMWVNANADIEFDATEYEDSDDYETDVEAEDDGEDEDEVVQDDGLDVGEPK